MKKNILFILILFLITQVSFAMNVGYVDLQKVVSNYSLAQRYRKEINNKFDEVNKYIKKQELILSKIKDENEKNEKRKQITINVEKKQNEYIELRKKREAEIDKNIRQMADKIREEKNLDVIIKKDSAMSGGVDLTQDFINRLK